MLLPVYFILHIFVSSYPAEKTRGQTTSRLHVPYSCVITYFENDSWHTYKKIHHHWPSRHVSSIAENGNQLYMQFAMSQSGTCICYALENSSFLLILSFTIGNNSDSKMGQALHPTVYGLSRALEKVRKNIFPYFSVGFILIYGPSLSYASYVDISPGTKQ